MLLNAAKCQGNSFNRFWVIKGKPTGGIQIRINPWYVHVRTCYLHLEIRPFALLPPGSGILNDTYREKLQKQISKRFDKIES